MGILRLPYTFVVLLRVGFSPATHESGHGSHTRLLIILDSPQREIASDVCVQARKHACPLASVLTIKPDIGKCDDSGNLRIGVDAPWFSARLDGSDPLFCERLVTIISQLPGITWAWIGA